MRHLPILALLAGCMNPASTPAQPVAASAEPPAPPAMEVVVSGSGGATLEVGRRGQDGYDKVPTRVNDGSSVHLVALGTSQSFQIAASSTELQRIGIDGREYFVQLSAGSTIALTDNPCNGWELTSLEADPNGAEPPRVVCAGERNECPERYASSAFPGLADDPLCADDERRCVLMTTLTNEVEGLAIDGEPLAVGDTIGIAATLCTFSELSWKNDRVWLFPPIGGRWTITSQGDRLVGRIDR